ncbi:MAG: hypothetical protein ACFFC7_20050 [Candidatus Hermodarchaeota archaeon]
MENTRKANFTIIKENKPLFLAAIILLLYAIIEIIDSITLPLAAAGLIPNPYLLFDVAFSEIRYLLEFQPLFMIAMFWAFTSMRIVAAIGLFINRMWGFWMGIFVSGITMCVMVFFFPISTIEGLISAVVVILLFIGYFGDQPIIQIIYNVNGKYI